MRGKKVKVFSLSSLEMDLPLHEMEKAHTGGTHFGEGERRDWEFSVGHVRYEVPVYRQRGGNVEAIWSSGQRSWLQIEA